MACQSKHHILNVLTDCFAHIVIKAQAQLVTSYGLSPLPSALGGALCELIPSPYCECAVCWQAEPEQAFAWESMPEAKSTPEIHLLPWIFEVLEPNNPPLQAKSFSAGDSL